MSEQFVEQKVKSSPPLYKSIGRGACNFVGSALNSTPGIGHAKGLIHYICLDVEGGNTAMKTATRSSFVVAGGIGGALAGGPPGAVAGGIGAGVAVDGAYTGLQSAISGGYAPYRVFQSAKDIVTSETRAKKLWSAAEMSLTIALDGVAGYQVGEQALRLRAERSQNIDRVQLQHKNAASDAAIESMDDIVLQQVDDAISAGARKVRDEFGLVSLPGALKVDTMEEFVNSFPHTLQKQVKLFLANEGKSLTVQEAAAKLYTSNVVYGDMAKDLCSGNPDKAKNWHTMIALLREYSRMNPLQHETIAWRGSKLTRQQVADMRPGKLFTAQNFGSASRIKPVVKTFQPKHVLKIIFPEGCDFACDLASISQFPGEAEILLMPGTQFEVLHNFTNNPNTASKEGADIVLRVLAESKTELPQYHIVEKVVGNWTANIS